MIPSAANSDYPKFVADQVLTSDNLNDLFGYLDEQGRMTRTNLSGIGIVCGLDIKTSPDGSGITISKGVGVTSSGYLISVPEVKYTKRTTNVFDAVKCEYYRKFVNISAKTSLFNLWELKQEAEGEGTTLLDNTFLTDGEKIVLIFVELLEENNKNCDPNSCDDKGINVTVNFRPLLVAKEDAGGLLSGAGSGATPWLSLPEISMKRFDVTATTLFECLNIFKAYQRILTTEFLTNTQNNLSSSYNVLKPILADEFPFNPFSTVANDFKFLNDGSLTSDQLINMQYYYDLFSDILMAYAEFRKKGIEVIGMCCPDDLFPRHLLLGPAIPGVTTDVISYRHYFIPSPILSDQQKTVARLKILFRKLVLLIQKFAVPPPDLKGRYRLEDTTIRITPSLLADVPFSTKSIPYYYAINNSADILLKNWNPQKLLEGKITRNLSYHAIKYNLTDDDIRQPLLYDLEPYNFLRIEGHIGKPYQQVVRNISALRDKNRLPFQIVALSADISTITDFLKNIGQLLSAGNANAQATLESLMGTSCRFNDLELLFDSIMAELTGKLSNEMKFFYDLPRDPKKPILPAPGNNVPMVPLLVKTDSTYLFTNNSIGQEFEQFYATVKTQAFIPLNVFFQSFGQNGNNDLMDFVFKAVVYYIELLYETITTGLSNFNFVAFYTRYYTLIQTVRYIKLLNKAYGERYPLSEEENDHLDALLSISADGRMIQLYFEFLRRVLVVKIMQQAGYYVRCHPGIQHKSGVTMGGTFIVVYHEVVRSNAQVAGPRVAMTHVEGNVPIMEKRFFDISPNNSTKTVFVKETKVNENASMMDHLESFSTGVTEKVSFAGDRIISGLQRSIPVQAKNVVVSPVSTGIFNHAGVAAQPAADSNTTSSVESDNQKVTNFLLDATIYLKDRKTDPLDNAMSDIGNGMVIADFYLPYLCCSDCAPVQMIISGEPEQPNKPPVARPGDNASVQLPVNSITLDGTSSSDPDGTIKTYLWEKQSGADATIETPDQSKTVVSNLSQGVYDFKLTVTDDVGATNSADVTITVLQAANIPPIASATAKPIEVTLNPNNEGDTVLSGADSKDPDGQITSYSWSLSSGPADGMAIESDSKAVTKVKFTQPGTYVFKLVVTDDRGATDTTTVSVLVSVKPNVPPVAVVKAEPLTVTMSANGMGSALLDGSNSNDPDGTIVGFLWKLTTDIPVSISDASKAQTGVQFSKAGVYNFLLTVTDDKGATGTDNVSITVLPPPNQSPIAVASANPATVLILPTTGMGNTTLSSSDSSDPDGSIKAVHWTLLTGVDGVQIISPDASVSQVQFSKPGNYIFKLTVTDNSGAISETNVSVNVTQAAIPEKKCAPLGDIIADFKKLATADNPEIFNAFIGRYQVYEAIKAFYEKMDSAAIATLSLDQQVSFFVDQKIDSRLVTWIGNLKELVLGVSDFRLLALLMFNVHAELVYYISCMQKEDIDKAKVQMLKPLSSLADIFKSILASMATMNVPQKDVVTQFEKTIVAERASVKGNNEEAVKVVYVKILDTIIKFFS